MGDILTQIQDELDMLLNQMYITLRYINLSSPAGQIPTQPQQTTYAEHNAALASQSQSTSNPSQQPSQQPAIPPQPTQSEYAAQLAEFAQDIVNKEQQLEILFNALPGMGISEEEQRERMEALQRELEECEGERVEAVREREGLLRKVEEGIVGVSGV